MKSPPDTDLLELLQREPERGMELIFRTHYDYLCRRILRIVHRPGLAEDLAQDVFYDLWRKRERLQVRGALQAYLGRAGVNRALNYLRDRKPELFQEEEAPEQPALVPAAQDQLEAEELQRVIDRAVEELPDRCRLVFSLSRFEGYSNREVANELGITEKTVENQMTKALRMLRERLAPYLNEETKDP